MKDFEKFATDNDNETVFLSTDKINLNGIINNLANSQVSECIPEVRQNQSGRILKITTTLS